MIPPHPFPKTRLGQHYLWLGRLSNGKWLWGRLFQIDAIMVRFTLKRLGIQVFWVTQHHTWLFRALFPGITDTEITDFLCQLNQLEAAGLARQLAIEHIMQQKHRGEGLYLLICLNDQLSLGHSLSHAMAHHPEYFNPLSRALLSSGEHSNRQHEAFTQLIELRKQNEQIKTQINKLKTYPTIILCVMIAMLGFMLISVIPQFEIALQSFHAHLPWTTTLLFNASHLVQSPQDCLLIFIGSMLSIKIMRPQCHQIVRRLAVHFRHYHPFRNLYYDHLVSNWLWIIGLYLSQGQPISQPLRLLIESATDSTICGLLETLEQRIFEGHTFSKTLRSLKLITAEHAAHLSIGEKAQNLASPCRYIAKQLQQRLKHKLTVLAQTLEPLMMIGIGLIMGLIIIALYLPIFQMGESIL